MEKVEFKNREGFTLAGILHVPGGRPDEGVVIAHGFTGHKNANFIPELARDLEDSGYVVLRFDFRGNGESDGKFEEGTWTGFSEDLRSAVEFLKSMGLNRIHVVGFSMGGAVSIVTYWKFKNFDDLILIAPAIRPATDTFIKLAWRQLRSKDFVEFEDARGRKWRLNRSYFEDREKYDLLEIGKKLKGLRILIIIGERDKSVSISAAKEFYEQDPVNRKFVLLPDEDHVFHNSARNISPHVIAFLKEV